VFGDKLFTGVGYPTPVSIPETTSCLTLRVPDDAAWWGITVGLLYSLVLEWNWQQFDGGLDRDVVAARWQIMLEDALDLASTTNSCVSDVPAPYWDTSEDADDEASAESQTWYGEVTDAEADPAELEFVENVGIWVITGFIAYSGQVAAAIYFHSIAPRFVLAWRRGDVVSRMYCNQKQAFACLTVIRS